MAPSVEELSDYAPLRAWTVGKNERKRKACLAVTNDCSYFGLYEAHMSVILPRLRVCVDGHEISLRPTAVSRSLPIVIRQTLHAK
jgi:hypothetical protein